MPLSKALASDQEMLHFLNEASEILFESLSLEDELNFDDICRLIVPHLADWFAIDIYDEKEGFKLLAVAHKDPEKVKWAHQWRKKYPTDYHSPTGLGAVVRTGKPEVYFNVPDEMIKAAARDDEHLKIMREIGFQSVIIMPLKARNVPFGAMTFVSTRESERDYTEEDLAPIESFANKVAIAIDNKKLYALAQDEIHRRKENEIRIKNLLEQSKLKQTWLDDIIRTIPGIVWETRLNPEDNSQKVNFISEYAQEMMGYPLEDWYNTPNFWEKILHPEDAERTFSNIRQTYEEGSGQDQYRWIAKSGNVVWTETRSFVLYDEKNNPVGMRGVTFDITQLKELENRKDEFIGIASHELKTPITSAKILTQCLQENKQATSPENFYLLKKLDQQLDKLIFLINSMLDVNRLQDNRIHFHDEPFDMNLLVKDIVDTFGLVYPNEITIEGRIEKKIIADKERVGQVILNLVNNAIKYSEKGKQINISFQNPEDSVCVVIEDQGVGIEERYLDKIFDKFFRIPDPNIKYVSGMGLGLNISRQIVNHYHGKIWANSIPGQGSTFCFCLPSLITC